MIADETGEVHKSSHLQMFLQMQACNFVKKTLQHWCFPVNTAKFLRTAFFYRTPAVTAFGYSNQLKIF